MSSAPQPPDLQQAPKASAPSNCYANWSVVWRNGEPIAAFPTVKMATGWIAEAPHRSFDEVLPFGQPPKSRQIRRSDFVSLRDFNRAYQRERRRRLRNEKGQR